MKNQITILIVEDEMIVAEDMKRFLLSLDYDVCAIASSGRAAIQKTEELQPDLVIMDIILKGKMDGIETSDYIRSRFGIPVIFVVTNADEKTVGRAKQTEPYGYIVKPYKEEELKAVIEMALYKHRFEKKLKESEEKYRTLFEASTDAIFLETLEGRILDCNQSACEMLGYTKEELLGLTVTDLVPENIAKTLPDIITEEQTTGGIFKEAINKRKDGSLIPVEVSTRLMKVGGEQLVVAYIRDITERKKFDEALMRSEKRYKSLFSMVRLMCDNVPDLIWAKDLNKKFLFTNKAICEKLLNAKDTDEPIGKTDLFFAERERRSHPENPEYHTFGKTGMDSDSIVMKSRTPKRFDEFGNLKNKFLFLDVYKAPFWDETGKMIGTVGCGRDVTKEQQIEEERKQTEEKLKKSQKQLSSLTAHLQSVREEERANVAREIHDELGQSLTALKMDLFWMDQKIPKDENALRQKILDMIELTDATIQSVKRISTELRPGLLDDLGLSAAIEWQADEFQKHTGIRCKITIEPEEIILDKELSIAIFRIFQETLTNIARHAQATKVQTWLIKKEHFIKLDVQDNGKGITEKQMHNIKSFGLIGIRERASFLGGKVKITGEKNRGTVISVSIPLSSD
ncbi:MAG: PAS domain S-box protein [bacterium]